MKTTKTLAILPLAFGAALATSTTANAQAMSFAGIDTNSDGMLAASELEAAFGANAQLALEQYDLNGDGMVEVEEATKVSNRGAVNAQSGMETAAEATTEDGEEIPRGLMTAQEAIEAAEDRQAEMGVGASVNVEAGASGS